MDIYLKIFFTFILFGYLYCQGVLGQESTSLSSLDTSKSETIKLIIRDVSFPDLNYLPFDSLVIMSPIIYDKIAKRYNINARLNSTLYDYVIQSEQEKRIGDKIRENYRSVIASQDSIIKESQQYINFLQAKNTALIVKYNNALVSHKKTIRKNKKKGFWRSLNALVGGIIVGGLTVLIAK